MFVSSFSTYITNNTSNRAAKTTANTEDEKSSSFTHNLSKNTKQTPLLKQSTSINYISQGKAQYNKQMIEISQKSMQNSKNNDFKTANKTRNSFSSNASIKSAKVAYVDNSKMFSIVAKPKISINTQTISGDKYTQEKAKYSAINTYISNDKYFQITA